MDNKKFPELKYKQVLSRKFDVLTSQSNMPETILKNYNKFEDYKIDHTGFGKKGIVNKEVIESRKNAKIKIMNYCKNIEENYKKGKSLFIYGPGTTGKSVLSCLLLKYAIRFLGKTSFFVNFSTIIGETYTPFDYRSDHFMSLIEKYIEPEFLCIDEIDNIHATKHLQSFMTMILSSRKDQCKPTIITSKISNNDLEFVLGNVVSNIVNNGLDYDIIEILAENKKVQRFGQIEDHVNYDVKLLMKLISDQLEIKAGDGSRAARKRMEVIKGSVLKEIINQCNKS